MKKRRNAKKANDLLAGALALVLVFLAGRFLVAKAENQREKGKIYVEVFDGKESRLLELKRRSLAKDISPLCPKLALDELDRVVLREGRCQLIKGGASNWARFALGKKMLLNQATLRQIEIVQGVGVKRAEELVQLRWELGGFSDFSQLKSLRWMSPQIISELKRYFTLEDGR